VTVKGRFKRKRGKRTRRSRLQLPLDGALGATIKTTGSLKARLSLEAPDARLGPANALSYEVCGAREATLVVNRVKGRGRFTVTVLRP
jgi:hypothetical protein